MNANRFYSFVAMRVLLIDNYDSFTFNLVHAIESLVDELVIWRNDSFDIEDVASFDKIIFSPGPSLPIQAGLMMQIIEQYHQTIPMLGVCLGFQAIIEFFGGELINMNPVRHGETRLINIIPEHIFSNLKPKQKVGLYHSWGVAIKDMPDEFTILATDESDIVMAFSHKKYELTGVQFHPESVMTDEGSRMLQNWINQ